MPSSLKVGRSGSSAARFGPGHREGAHLAGLDVRQRPAERREPDFGAAGQHVGDALRHLAVGHVLHLDAGHVAEQHGGEMRARADADRAVVQLAGIGLGVGDHVLDRLERRLHRDREHLLRGGHQHDRLEARDRIERGGRRQRDVDRRASARRSAACSRRGAACAAAAAPMLPLPPGRFSTMTCWPHISLRWSAMKRPSTSIAPDGENAMTILTGRVGIILRRRSWPGTPSSSAAGHGQRGQ